ncbi:hypothetical protein KEM52_001836 [Ascosphaera acerosa]|nr:hypothetical protein KEM52_001836 [Ascosphaera acerosa]
MDAEGCASEQARQQRDYKGFLAGVFSGVTKCTVGHPFDTIKVRLQTSSSARFAGPLDCVLQTVRNEGVLGMYKGMTPPLIGWMFMDSVMLGSLTLYRRLLLENLFGPALRRQGREEKLPWYGHGLAGMGAGATVSFIAAPVEHLKARLQIQYAARKQDRMYSSPIDCAARIYRAHGVRGVYRGLCSTLLFRSFFFCWWASYDLLTTFFREHTTLSTPAINFWAGGLSAQVFWLTSYPADIVKQRIMTDPLGGSLGDGTPRFRRWRDAAVAVGRDGGGARAYWRGFLPCFLRAFPANAMALVAFEGVMRALPSHSPMHPPLAPERAERAAKRVFPGAVARRMRAGGISISPATRPLSITNANPA